jgi:hypothetical protein
VSAATEYQEAQRATMTARDALSALRTQIDAGDYGVTGADLMVAKSDLEVCEGLEVGPLARMQEEQAAAVEAGRQAKIEAARAEDELTAAELTEDIQQMRAAITKVLDSSARHQGTSRALASALTAPGGVPQRSSAPSPVEVIDAVIELAFKDNHLRTASSYPHLAIEPIAHFLPVGVTV